MSHAHDQSVVEDPCGTTGPVQRAAYCWAVSVIIIGVALAYFLARADRWMYTNNGEFLDNKAYKQNRASSYSIPSEVTDHRKHGDLSSAASQL